MKEAACLFSAVAVLVYFVYGGFSVLFCLIPLQVFHTYRPTKLLDFLTYLASISAVLD